MKPALNFKDMGRHLILILLSIIAFSACDDDKLPNIRPAATDEFVDERDGNVYEWIRIGDLEWMTSNLKYGTPYFEREYGGAFVDDYGDPQVVESQFIDFDMREDFETNGNLYMWEELEEMVPDGWRLPTDEDWKNLELALGMSQKEADKEGWRGDQVATLLRQGKDGWGMELQLSGCAWQSGPYGDDIILTNIDECGYFWSATEVEDNGLQVPTVYFRKIIATQSTVYRGTTPLNILMRVRCVRDAQ